MSVIAVIDYDMGNLHSACKGLENAGATPKITDNPQEIYQADAVVLPGVGAFDPAMEHLRSRQLEEPIKKVKVKLSKKQYKTLPFLTCR